MSPFIKSFLHFFLKTPTNAYSLLWTIHNIKCTGSKHKQDTIYLRGTSLVWGSKLICKVVTQAHEEKAWGSGFCVPSIPSSHWLMLFGWAPQTLAWPFRTISVQSRTEHQPPALVISYVLTAIAKAATLSIANHFTNHLNMYTISLNPFKTLASSVSTW